MTAVAGPNWENQQDSLTTRLPDASAFEEPAMREKLFAIRDTMIVLSLQLVFRAFMLARRWNY